MMRSIRGHSPPPRAATAPLRGGQVGHPLHIHNQAAQLGRVLHAANVLGKCEGRSGEVYKQRILKCLLQILPKMLFLLPKLLFLLPDLQLILAD
jgi:hypothetical protein